MVGHDSARQENHHPDPGKFFHQPALIDADIGNGAGVTAWRMAVPLGCSVLEDVLERGDGVIIARFSDDCHAPAQFLEFSTL
jgi:hypothetical protein